jgi:hypothetical protein
MRTAKREWTTSINRAAMLKQSIAFVDPRMLPFPGACFVGAVLTPGTTSFYFIIAMVVTYLLARAQYLRWPWAIDDLLAEMAYHYELPDIGDQ